MQAYHNDPAIKEKYLARVRAHKEADEIVHQWIEWKDGWDAIGCTVHSDDHKAYETELGIPEVLAHLEDRIFDGLPFDHLAMLWPERFLSAIRVGADLSRVWPQFAVWFLTDPQHGVIRFSNAVTRPAIQRVADWYAGSMTDREEIRRARAGATAAAMVAHDTNAWSAALTAADIAMCAWEWPWKVKALTSDVFLAQSKKLIELLEAA